MAETGDATPQPRRRLGLRLRKGAHTTPGARRQLTTPLAEENQTKSKNEPDATPRCLPQQLQPKANSTSCRRLGLSRRHCARKELNRKRLEFVEHTPVEAKPGEAAESAWRERKITELEADIETWRRGFAAAVEDLQALSEPRVAKETLLRQLQIPLEMLRYLEED
ncbi:hypothetical protein KR222_006557 [Zaprionus bogoriensis]|nr:hypothetical protein KR222_006557 [Zaprionus bogoriensis]